MSVCKEEKKAATTDSLSTPAPSNLPAGAPETTVPTTVIDPVTGQAVTVGKPIAALSTAISPNPSMTVDPVPIKIVAPDPKTPQESRVVRVLTTNYWSVWALSRIGDKPANRQNQGAWFKFNPDGTYQYGFFEKPIAKGAWTFDASTAKLHLDSELVGDDREWEIKIGNDEDVMVWVGTERYVTTSIQLKLISLLFIPKKRSELGLED